MQIDEVKELMEAISEKTRAAIKDHVKEEIAPVVQAVETIGIEQRKFSGSIGYTSGNDDPIHRIVQANKANIQAVGKGEKRSHSFTINKTLVARSAVSGSTMAWRAPGVGELPYLGAVISGLFPHVQVGPSSNGVIRYYDQLAITRGAASVAEGATKPESAITWIERES